MQMLNVLLRFISGGNGGGEFSIVAINGDVSLASGLDYETLTAYVIEVTVTDTGVPPLSSTTLLGVSVTPINEITPSFPGAPYSTSVDEDNAIGKITWTCNSCKSLIYYEMNLIMLH